MVAEFGDENIIFNAKGQAAERRYLYEDALVMCHFSRGIYREAKIPAVIEVADFIRLAAKISSVLAKNVAIDTPSIFKRATAFTVAFIASTPLKVTFSGAPLSQELLRVRNHQNAIVAFEYCRKCLHGAKINHHPDNVVKTLSNRITVSPHSYIDTVTALAQITEDVTNFHLLTLLYESYAYRNNPEASYKPLI